MNVYCMLLSVCAYALLTSYPQISFKARRDISVKHYPSSIAAGDLDRDGQIDLVTANHGSGNISIFYGNAEGSYAGPIDISAGAGPAALALADFNRDDRPDIVVANWLSSSISIVMSEGGRGFSTARSYSVGNGPTSVVAADF